MPHKRRSRQKTHNFYCPYCQKRLWRQGSRKHYLIYTDVDDIRQHLGISRKNARLLVATNSSYIDRKSWIEEFYCQTDGRIWLTIAKNATGDYVASLAKESHWKQTIHTLDPNRTNPSISEFSYRMSRCAKAKVV